ncbi:RNA helicase-like protein [Thozetella sp. PMI_491]|nr:RNA helicase-like protein [Thozetella sp. PMI_491]
MVQKLNDFDKARIDKGLEKAKQIIEENGPMATAKLAGCDVSAVLALFEALCSMPYLALPGNRVAFNYVFENTQMKKPLRMQGGIIPTMTFFLFDADPFRNKFATAAWDRIPAGSLTQETWDWAVNAHLAEAIYKTSVAWGMPAADQICRFWKGFLLILNSLSEELVLNCLRAMEVNPSVYYLAFEHLATDSDAALSSVLDGLRALMEKSSKAFWSAFEQTTPSYLVAQITASPAFRTLLAHSLVPASMVEQDGRTMPALAAWMQVLFRSLPPRQRPDLCSTLLLELFETFRTDPSCSPEGRATCTLTGLVALKESLEGFLQPPGLSDTQTSLIMVNQLLDRVVGYKEVIISAAELKSTDKYNVGLSETAMSVIHAALALDARATNVEWNAIHDNLPVQSSSDRESGTLWESFLEMLWSGRVELAKTMLVATIPLRAVEQFKPPRNQQLSDTKKRFNVRYQQQATAIGKILGRLTDFSPADLDEFCAGRRSQTIHPIVASLIHGEAAIQEAGFELIKAITGETSPFDAVHKMLDSYFETFLDAFSEAVKKITVDKDSNIPWSHMASVLKCSELILNGLSDPSVGLLRSKALTEGERTVVERWWETEWQTIDHSFSQLKHWHVSVDKKTMENFCRDVMELADKFLAQDGLMASALGQASSVGTGGGYALTEASAKSMGEVLKPVLANSGGLVDMLQLRDIYLIQGVMEILHKLLRRSRENSMTMPRRVIAKLESMLKKRKTPDGRTDYALKTNLTDSQRIALLKDLGQDAQIEEEYLGAKRADKEKTAATKLQSRLDFSKATPISGANVIETKGLDMYNKSNLKLSTTPVPKPKPVVDQKAILAKQLSIREQRQKEKEEKAKRDAEIIARAKALRTVPGEGSGMMGIAGARGKDHVPAAALQKDEMMVGSSSEDEDDDDDEEDALIIQRGTGKRTMDEAERRRLRALALKQRGPVKKTKIERSAKDMRARIIPPMDVLHQAILEWDIFHKGNDPPNGYQCLAVADSYPGPTDYKKTFFPLLINEAWRSFVTAKDEATSKPYGLKILNRMTVDKFIEVTTSMPAKDNKDRMLSEGDIVVISQGDDPLHEASKLHCLARIFKTSYKRESLEVVYRLNSKGNQIMPVLLPGAEFHATKITNMTTIEREYAALESLQYYDLMDEVLKAEPSPILDFGKEAVDNIMKNYDLNPGQAKAILNAKANDGFTLVQGPPGTGKTKTIVAMVGSLLTGVIKPGASNAVAVATPGQPATNGQALPKKLLVCAPSNAAVDELVLRLKAGIKTLNGTTHKISVLRLGRSDAINAAVRDVTLDELVKARLEADAKENGNVSSRDQMFQEANEIKAKITELRPQLEAAREGEDRSLLTRLQREFDDFKRRQAQIGARIEADKSSGNTYAREMEIKRRQIQQQILDGAHVLCATLSGSGHEMFKNLNVEFETVIIDEAAQCVELSALIPLKYGCSKCILVGDPKQLPPTVLSQSAARYGYDQSLFVRMHKRHAKDVHLLDRQYRMHPLISQFPSAEFYEGLLRDGDDMAKLRRQPWHRSSLLGPYRFFDVKGSQERGPRNQSLVNEEELKVAMQLYDRFRLDFGGRIEMKGKIGIITPYKAQLFRLRQKFTDRYGEGITDAIEFNTTDAFQGRECEIIIFSCVRASPTGGIGFMTDIRRMNVGLTRAKSSLWILGDSRALAQGEYWHKLIENARQRNLYTTGDVLGMLRKPSAQHPAGDDDVDMPDVSSAPSIDHAGEPAHSGPSAPVSAILSASRIENKLSRSPSLPPPPTELQHGRSVGISGGRSEPIPTEQRGHGIPVVRATLSPPRDGAVGKRRSSEGTEGANPPPAKRREPQLLRRPIPKGPKAIRPPKPPKRDTDPSAEQVLGLVPPVRPPAAAAAGPAAATQQRNPPPSVLPANGATRPSDPAASNQQRAPPNAPRAPRPKPPADPFVRRRR